MGVSTLISLGLRTMQAQQAALQATGHNIANANVPGYSRQQAEFATATGQYTGAGFFGKGVDVETVSRSHNEFLTRDAAMTKSAAAMDAARLAQLQKLENVFPTGERGLGNWTQQLLNAFGDVASRPSDLASRQVVLSKAQEMATRFTSANQQIGDIQRAVGEELGGAINTINTLTGGIADLNHQIANVQGRGQPPNDLLDQRDQLVSRLSEQIQVTTLQSPDGTLTVFAAGGQNLVLSKNAQKMAVLADERDPTRSAIAIVDKDGPRRLPPDILGGGRVAGLLRFQNDDLVAARNAIGQLAAGVAGAVNQQQRMGLTAQQPAGAGADLFGFGAPQALPAATNARDANGPIASVSLTITQPSKLVASDYDLRADPSSPGQWRVTRLSDGNERTIDDGDEVDGFRIQIGAPAPAAGDKFLLQPLARAATMQSLLQDPRDVAAASPLTATMGGANSGTAEVASFRVTDGAVNAQNSASITFTNDSGAYAWELRDRGTNALVSSGTGTWAAGASIPSGSGAGINSFELTLSGVPRAGDTLLVDKTLYPGASNGNALALAALRDAALVGNQTSTDAYATAMTDVGTRVQSAKSLSTLSGAMASSAETIRSSASGINLDEEAAHLIQYQQSYQAAAKVLQVAQSLFDTLLQTAAR